MELSEVFNQLKGFQSSLDGKIAEILEKQGIHARRLDMLQAQIERPDAGRGGGNGATGFAGYERPGDRLIKQTDMFDMLRKTRQVRFELKSFWPNFEEKTLIDSTALGLSTPGILNAERVSGIVALPRRRLTIRDMLRSRPITAAQIDWIRENVFTNAASPQTEGSAKAESADTFVIASSKVTTLAHWIPLTRQAMDDVPELARFVNENLMYGLKLKEEDEILNGDGTGDHLSGLTTQAGAYAATYVAGSDTKVHTLRHAILELADLEEECNGFVLHPKDFHDIELIRDESGGANTGKFLVGDPLGGALAVRTLWGRPCVITRSMTSGKFLAGNFAAAIIGDRMDATIDLSYEHSTYFTENKVAIRAEERVALAVLRTSAFCYGSF